MGLNAVDAGAKRLDRDRGLGLIEPEDDLLFTKNVT